MDSEVECVDNDDDNFVNIRQRKQAHEEPFRRRADGRYICNCGKTYKEERYLRHHLKWECNKVPAFRCSFCPYNAKRRSSMKIHLSRRHKCENENMIIVNALKWMRNCICTRLAKQHTVCACILARQKWFEERVIELLSMCASAARMTVAFGYCIGCGRLSTQHFNIPLKFHVYYNFACVSFQYQQSFVTNLTEFQFQMITMLVRLNCGWKWYITFDYCLVAYRSFKLLCSRYLYLQQQSVFVNSFSLIQNHIFPVFCRCPLHYSFHLWILYQFIFVTARPTAAQAIRMSCTGHT